MSSSGSGGYASRLKEYPHKGKCGLPENRDTSRILNRKLETLVKMIREAKRLVLLTGAGISTSAGIPDFRGPKGIWTLEQERQKQQQATTTQPQKKRRKTTQKDDNDDNKKVLSFATAKPTLTHYACVELWKRGKLSFCVTQNVDGLHQRSGMSRNVLAVLHGCVFTEKCEDCHLEYIRDYEMETLSFSKTGRQCDKCGGDLRDTLLDWEDALPRYDYYDRCIPECDQADLVLTLGTSLRIEPAGSLPTRAKKFCIVNYQQTPYDDRADLVIRASVDLVMNHILTELYGAGWNENRGEVELERTWKRPLPSKSPSSSSEEDEDEEDKSGDKDI